MKTSRRPLRRLPLAAVCALCLLPSLASATLYEMSWTSRWGDAKIVYDTAVLDTNVTPTKGAYYGAIVSYDLLGWSLLRATRVRGTGGSIVVNARQGVETEEGCLGCTPATLTFALGSSSRPFDTYGWTMTMSVPWVASTFADGLPGEGSYNGDGYGLDGYTHASLYQNNNPSHVLSILSVPRSPEVVALAAPVPEPAEWAMLGLGLGLLGVWRRAGRKGFWRGTSATEVKA